MNKKAIALVIIAGLLGANPSFAALNEVDKSYLDQLLKGGWTTLQQVGENMFNTSYSNTEVLDVVAQTALEKYPQTGTDFTTVNSVAWLCRALGASGNNRYRPVLEKIAEDKAMHRKLRGHCEKAAKQLPKGSTDPYVAGTVNLELLRNPPPPPPPPPAPASKGKKNAKNGKAEAAPATATAVAPAATATAAATPATATAPAGPVDLSKIQVGMSQQQVNELLGPPTAQTQRMTGKQWQPFNYGARDLQRMMYFYKGAGRIEFSLKSGYEGVFRVITVTPNPAETGYP